MTSIRPKQQTRAPRTALDRELSAVSNSCVRCQICVTECQFLQTYGDPKTQADRYDADNAGLLNRPFECSLCDLCTAVCPHGVEPPKMFLEMRREAFDRGQTDQPEYRALRSYERKGTSKRFSWYALPEGCDTIFFPGCALAGTRSEITLKVFEHLQQSIPAVGIVLDCCTKPSHDLGDDDYFTAMFGEMKSYLSAQGIKTILLACPNCDKVFKTYATEFNVRTVYEMLDLPEVARGSGKTVALHDPCTARFNAPAQDAVRNVLKQQGFEIAPQPHSGKQTFCCGEGGAVNCFKPELAGKWSRRRIDEAAGLPIVSYCAGCTQILGKQAETYHILDTIFGTETKVAQAPLTYFKRLNLKKVLQKNVAATVTRERTFQPQRQKSTGNKNRVLILTAAVLLLMIPSIFFFLR